MNSKDLSELLETCQKETGGTIHDWVLILHVDGPGGSFTGEVTLSVCYSVPEKGYQYWNRMVRNCKRQ